MRRRLLLTMVGLTVAAVLVVGVPTGLVADPDTQALVLGLGAAVIVAGVAAALGLSGAVAPPRGGAGRARRPAAVRGPAPHRPPLRRGRAGPGRRRPGQRRPPGH